MSANRDEHPLLREHECAETRTASIYLKVSDLDVSVRDDASTCVQNRLDSNLTSGTDSDFQKCISLDASDYTRFRRDSGHGWGGASVLILSFIGAGIFVVSVAAGFVFLNHLGTPVDTPVGTPAATSIPAEPAPGGAVSESELSSASYGVGEKEQRIQRSVVEAYEALAAGKILKASSLFKQAYHLEADGVENKYPAAELCLRAGDSLVDASTKINQSGSFAPGVNSDTVSQEAAWFYRQAISIFSAANIFPEKEIEALIKLESVGAEVSEFERHLSLLESQHYPPAQIESVSYDLGTRYAMNNKMDRAEKAWIRGLPKRTDIENYGYSFPGPAGALADLYYTQHKDAEEAAIRKISAGYYDRAVADGEHHLYGWAAECYERWLACLHRLGRQTEFAAVSARYNKLKMAAKKGGYLIADDGNSAPHKAVGGLR